MTSEIGFDEVEKAQRLFVRRAMMRGYLCLLDVWGVRIGTISGHLPAPDHMKRQWQAKWPTGGAIATGDDLDLVILSVLDPAYESMQ